MFASQQLTKIILNMKLYTIFLVLCSALTICYCAGINPEYLDIVKACNEANNVSENEHQEFLANIHDVSKITHNMRCSVKCVGEKMGILKDGVVQLEEFVKFLKQHNNDHSDADIAMKVEICNKEKDNDECEKAFKIRSCLTKEFGAIKA